MDGTTEIEEVGWEPFSEDTPEAVEAWAAGRRARLHGGDLPPGVQAKQLGLYPENQTYRIEWDRGWDYQGALMQRERVDRGA